LSKTWNVANLTGLKFLWAYRVAALAPLCTTVVRAAYQTASIGAWHVVPDVTPLSFDRQPHVWAFLCRAVPRKRHDSGIQ
jgi:hypothetical protein